MDLALDLLDQLLFDLRQEGCVFGRVEASEPWRIEKGKCAVAPFYAILSGTARVETASAAHNLSAGDFICLPSGEPHHLCGQNSAAAPPVSLLTLAAQAGVQPWQPGIRYRKPMHCTLGGSGAQSLVLYGIFSFGDPRRNPLLAALPPVLVLRGPDPSQAPAPGSWSSRPTVQAIAEELAQDTPGSTLVVAKLADLLFTQALRASLKDNHPSPGWLRGIKDPLVGRAISRMHASPSHPWTVASLASEAGCSRAVFAERFSTLVGQGALSYLTAWRMHTAAGLLLARSGNVAEIAGQVGYSSEAAFSFAFKRWSGTSPGRYRQAITIPPGNGNGHSTPERADHSEPAVQD